MSMSTDGLGANDKDGPIGPDLPVPSLPHEHAPRGQFRVRRYLLNGVLGHKECDPPALIDVRNTGTLVGERGRMRERPPPDLPAFVDGAGWAAPVLVVGDVDAERPGRRTDEHVVLDGVLGTEIVGAMDTTF
jgi:hypothetical protein